MNTDSHDLPRLSSQRVHSGICTGGREPLSIASRKFGSASLSGRMKACASYFTLGRGILFPRKKWEKDAPGLSIESLTEHDAPIKAHFRSPEVQYIGSTSGCGCDFPHATLQNGEWPEIGYLEYLEQDAESVAIDKRNREALVDMLRQSRDNVVELYGIWDGDFVEAPKVQESIAAETILDSGFLFKERGFYTDPMHRI